MTDDLQKKYARLLREGKTEEATKVSQKMVDGVSESSVDKQEDVLEPYVALNGVGEELAEELYEKYGDYSSFVEDADMKGLVDVSGVGESRAESLLEQME